MIAPSRRQRRDVTTFVRFTLDDGLPMTTQFVKPTEGQTWVHRQFGQEVKVLSTTGNQVVVEGRAGKMGMLDAQLNEHYYPAT
jgi:hypothetical protein